MLWVEIVPHEYDTSVKATKIASRPRARPAAPSGMERPARHTMKASSTITTVSTACPDAAPASTFCRMSTIPASPTMATSSTSPIGRRAIWAR